MTSILLRIEISLFDFYMYMYMYCFIGSKNEFIFYSVVSWSWIIDQIFWVFKFKFSFSWVLPIIKITCTLILIKKITFKPSPQKPFIQIKQNRIGIVLDDPLPRLCHDIPVFHPRRPLLLKNFCNCCYVYLMFKMELYDNV